MKKTIIVSVFGIAALAALAQTRMGSVAVGKDPVLVQPGTRPIYLTAVSDTNATVAVRYVTFVPVTNSLGAVSVSGGTGFSASTNVTFRSGDYVFAEGPTNAGWSAQMTITE